MTRIINSTYPICASFRDNNSTIIFALSLTIPTIQQLDNNLQFTPRVQPASKRLIDLSIPKKVLNCPSYSRQRPDIYHLGAQKYRFDILLFSFLEILTPAYKRSPTR